MRRRSSSTVLARLRKTCRDSCNTSNRCRPRASARLTGSRAHPPATRRMGLRDRGRPAGPAHRLVHVAELADRPRRHGHIRAFDRRARHRSSRVEMLYARRAASSASRSRACSAKSRAADPRRPAPSETVARSRRGRHDGRASRADGAVSWVGPRSGGACHESAVLARDPRGRGRARAGPGDPQSARRDHPRHDAPRSAARTCISTTATCRPCTSGDILGHEFMGEVVEVGPQRRQSAVGDRVVVPFPIACGNCFFCETRAVLAVRELESERRMSRKSCGAIRAPGCSAIRT